MVDPKTLEASQVCFDLIKQQEGLHDGDKATKEIFEPEICPAGYPTLGWGSRYDMNGNVVTMQTEGITLSVAECLLDKQITIFEKIVRKHVKAPLSQNQFDALVCFVYNIGEANFASSTLLKLLNQRLYIEASAQFYRWNKARVNGVMTELKGLTKRRELERDLFLKV